jgi:transposase-like protein
MATIWDYNTRGNSAVATRLDSKKIEVLRQCFKQGLTLRAAAERVGCSPGTVYVWFRKFEVGRNGKT